MLPLGATMNMDGAALYEAVASQVSTTQANLAQLREQPLSLKFRRTSSVMP